MIPIYRVELQHRRYFKVLTTEEDLFPLIKANVEIGGVKAGEAVDTLVHGEIKINKACQPELIGMLIPPVVSLK